MKPEENQQDLNLLIQQLASQVTLPQRQLTQNKRTKSTNDIEITKLGQLEPKGIIAKSRESRFRPSGHRQAGVPSSRIKPNCKIPVLVLTISRKGNLSVYLKKAFNHFQKFKSSRITLVAMGGAISMCFSLAMAIESNLQLGPSCQLLKSILTGTVVVGDEITPKDHEIDSHYQTRNQASIEIQLMIEFIPDQLKSITSKAFS